MFLFLETYVKKTDNLHAHANRFVHEVAPNFILCGHKQGETTWLSTGELSHELLIINFILLLERLDRFISSDS